MLLIYAFLGLLCWAVSNVKGSCKPCEVLHCSWCDCDGTCESCEYGYTFSPYYDNVCVEDFLSSRSSSYYGSSSSVDDDEEDENRGSFVGIILVTVFLFSVIYAIVRCRLRQLETNYAPLPDPYMAHRFQPQRVPAMPPPYVPYSGQGRYSEPGSSTGPAVYYSMPNTQTNTSADSSDEKPRETAYVVGPDGELQVGIGK